MTPAGGQHGRPRASGQHLVGQPADLVDHVLAVVQDEQRPAQAQPLEHGPLDGLRRAHGHVQRVGDRLHHRAGHGPGSDRHEVDEGTPSGKPRLRPLRDSRHQPGFAHPTRADHGHQPRLVQRRLDGGHLRRAANEGRPASRQADERPGPGLLGQRGQGVSIGRVELAQQCRDVALHRAHRDVQQAGDLRVRQVLRKPATSRTAQAA